LPYRDKRIANDSDEAGGTSGEDREKGTIEEKTRDR